MRNALNIAMHIPYATNTPDAIEANTAEINTIDEFTAAPSDLFLPAPTCFGQLSLTHSLLLQTGPRLQ
jgi:hypothetical protein